MKCCPVYWVLCNRLFWKSLGIAAARWKICRRCWELYRNVRVEFQVFAMIKMQINHSTISEFLLCASPPIQGSRFRSCIDSTVKVINTSDGEVSLPNLPSLQRNSVLCLPVDNLKLMSSFFILIVSCLLCVFHRSSQLSYAGALDSYVYPWYIIICVLSRKWFVRFWSRKL